MIKPVSPLTLTYNAALTVRSPVEDDQDTGWMKIRLETLVQLMKQTASDIENNDESNLRCHSNMTEAEI